MGSQELTGNTSTPLLATYGVRVGWFRDGFEYGRDMLEMLAAGRSVMATTIALLSKKMGVLRQNVMMMRLLKAAKRQIINTSGSVTGVGNYYRPNGKATLDSLVNTDTLSLSMAHNARARVRSLGATPISHRLSGTGSPLDGYLMFASDQAMLPIRNDSTFAPGLLAQGADRGMNNPLFTGELINWGGMQWYEFPIIDESWDDYLGNPLLPKAKIAVAFNGDTAVSTVGGVSGIHLQGSTATSFTTGSPRYFQFFDGYDYKFTEDQAAASDSDLTANPLETSSYYYAWACNPDGTYCFLKFLGSNNKGTHITITSILSAAAGTSTKGATTVGNLTVGSGGSLAVDGTSRVITLGNSPTANLTTWLAANPGKLVDKVMVGAILFQANANGNIIGRGFTFGAMAACFANGRITLNQIEQTRDYGFVTGKGFETIFGAGVTKTPNKTIGGYLVLEHVVKPEGYNPPYAA